MRHAKIELSAAQEAQLSDRLAAGEFPSFDAYVAALIDAETTERARDRLDELLLEGLNSEELAWTPELLETIRKDAGLTS